MEAPVATEKAKDPFQDWMDSTGLPIHRGHSLALPTAELAWWPERQCNADPFIRNYFEEELVKRGRESLMPDEACRGRDYVFAQAIPANNGN
jgi:hypothetical protein